MKIKQPMYEWLIRTLIAAIFSVIGFIGQDIYSDWKEGLALSEARLNRLRELSGLLDESKSIFQSQNYMAQRLMQLLRENHFGEVPQQLGYDDTFYKMYDYFQAEEAELQSILRSTTVNSMRRVNQDMSNWLDADKVFKSITQATKEREELSEQLRTLELHLNQWHDKYEAMIPNDKRRTLVYLDDEKRHGTGFPKGIEQVVKKTIENWQ